MIYKVVIADDEPIMRKAMQSLIDWDALGCHLVYVASTGLEVMEYLNTNIVDILILDIQMPGISGTNLAAYIYENRLPTKVILLTAYADFSYAQQAVKNDVVDYVIKTGSFEELLVAIEKAKTAIHDDALQIKEVHQDILMENFFKSIFDGSLYQSNDIQEKSRRIGLVPKKECIVISLRYSLPKDKQRNNIYQCFHKFFGMVFEQHMMYAIPMKEDEMLVVLASDKGKLEENIYEQCLKIVEMMERFMEIHVYIGLGGSVMVFSDLKKSYDQAQYAVEEIFFHENVKVQSYREYQKDSRTSLEELDSDVNELYVLMKKGAGQESLKQFDEIVEYMSNHECVKAEILDIGIDIISLCKKLLSEYDKALYEVVPYERNLSHKIYQCRHMSEFVEIVRSVIEHTVKFINVVVSKKNIVIYEAEKYIEENYQNCITVSEIARSVNVSLSYLSRIYKETTGNTLIHFINQKKIDKAKEYLRNTDMKIYEIAEVLGFENTTYFSYFFKKNTGMSPKEYKADEAE